MLGGRGGCGSTGWIAFLGEVSEEVVVEEFGAVIGVEAEEGKGKGISMSLICWRTSVSPFPHTALCPVQPVGISTKSMV